MKKVLGIGISVFILVFFITLIFNITGWPLWAAFMGWAIYFFLGANIDAFKKALPPFILGSLLGYLSMVVVSLVEATGALYALICAILGFIMTIAPAIPLFSAGACVFMGANIFFASGSLIDTLIAGIIGLLLGVVSVPLGQWFDVILYEYIYKEEL